MGNHLNSRIVALRPRTSVSPIEAPVPGSGKLDTQPLIGSGQPRRGRGRQKQRVEVEVLFYQRDERWVAEARDLRIACVARSRRDASTAIRAMLRSFLDGAPEIEVAEVEKP